MDMYSTVVAAPHQPTTLTSKTVREPDSVRTSLVCVPGRRDIKNVKFNLYRDFIYTLYGRLHRRHPRAQTGTMTYISRDGHSKSTSGSYSAADVAAASAAERKVRYGMYSRTMSSRASLRTDDELICSASEHSAQTTKRLTSLVERVYRAP